VPRETKVEHSGGVKAMSDEEIEQAIEVIQTMLAARAGEAAKVIEGTAEPAALPAPNGQSSEAAPEPAPLPKSNKPNRLLLEADTEVWPTERKARQGKVPSPRDPTVEAARSRRGQPALRTGQEPSRRKICKALPLSAHILAAGHLKTQ